MADRLPSLPALRVFEAAGRLLSFTRAAEELHVTQAAVSHQIRSLEEQLGQPLFKRSTRRLDLTPAGQRLLPAATAAFATLEGAVADLRRSKALLTVTTTAFFGARWLAPRLARFALQHPDIDVVVRHTNAVLDLAAEGIDVALRTGRGNWPGLYAQRIARPELVPVATPDYVERLGLKQRTDIFKANLLHDEGRQEWIDWLTMAGLDPAYGQTGAVFDDEHVLFATTMNGQGVSLAIRNLVEAELRQGSLVPVFDLTMGEGWGYYLVCLAAMAEVPKIATFCDFIAQEAAEEERRSGRMSDD
jgi:LysR family glycine cleavage system transcriptional activator